MWWRQAPPPVWLRAASRIYARFRDLDQAKRRAHAQGVNVPVVSVGNITVGGSGKTPFVIWLAAKLIERGLRPVVLCRGDGGHDRRARELSAQDDAASAGDEAMLLFESCSCPVVAGRDRIEGARIASTLGSVIVLDDGFQYRQLKRDCDVVLVPSAGVGNGRELPAGPLREPVSALGRAHVVVRTGDGSAEALSSGKEWRWRTVTCGLEPIAGRRAAPAGRLLAMSAIARSGRFIDSLKQEGHEVTAHLSFPDHHAYTPADVRRALAYGLDVAVTSKDAVKLRSIWPNDQPLWLLRQQGEGTQGLIEAILAPILETKKISGVDHAG